MELLTIMLDQKRNPPPFTNPASTSIPSGIILTERDPLLLIATSNPTTTSPRRKSAPDTRKLFPSFGTAIIATGSIVMRQTIKFTNSGWITFDFLAIKFHPTKQSAVQKTVRITENESEDLSTDPPKID